MHENITVTDMKCLTPIFEAAERAYFARSAAL